MGSATITDKASGNSATITFPDDATPEQVQANIAKVKPQLRQGAPGGAAIGSELAKTPAAPKSYRTEAGLAGGALGGLTGLAGSGGNPMGGLYGATTGYGLGTAGADYLEGRGDLKRDLITGVAPALAGPFSEGLGLASRLLASGGASAIAGQLYDAATGKLLGRDLTGHNVPRETLGEAAGAAVGDVAAGGVGQAMGEAGASLRGPSPRKPGGISAGEQAEREAFAAQEDIPLSASGRTGRKSVARTEQLPTRVPVGSDVSQGFYDRQLAATEASIQKRLQRLDVLAESRNPTVAGETTQAELPKLAGELSRAAEQGYGAVKQKFVAGVPTDVAPTKIAAFAKNALGQGPTAGPAHGALPVFYDRAGRPVTMGDIAAWTDPLSYDDARFYLKQLNAGTFKSGQPVVGDIDSGLREQLVGALKDDVGAMLDGHPDAKVLYGAVNDAYGKTKEMIVGRLQKLTGKLEPEKVAPALFRPGSLKRTMQMQQILPRERFEELAGAMANVWMQKAQTATSSGHVELSTAKLATQIKPYAESGQLDVMFPKDVADYFRSFLQFEPALQSTQRLAGNPSGTGQALLSSQQASGLMAPLKYPTDPNSYKTALASLMPGPLARFMFSPGGSDALTALGNQGPTATAARGAIANPVAAQIAQRGLQSPFMQWLSRQQ